MTLACVRHCRPRSVAPLASRKKERASRHSLLRANPQTAPVVVLVGGLEGTWRIFARSGTRSSQVRSNFARFAAPSDLSRFRQPNPERSRLQFPPAGYRLSRKRRIARTLAMDRQSRARSRGRCRRRFRIGAGAVAEPGRRFRQDSRRRTWTPTARLAQRRLVLTSASPRRMPNSSAGRRALHDSLPMNWRRSTGATSTSLPIFREWRSLASCASDNTADVVQLAAAVPRWPRQPRPRELADACRPPGICRACGEDKRSTVYRNSFARPRTRGSPRPAR